MWIPRRSIMKTQLFSDVLYTVLYVFRRATHLPKRIDLLGFLSICTIRPQNRRNEPTEGADVLGDCDDLRAPLMSFDSI